MKIISQLNQIIMKMQKSFKQIVLSSMFFLLLNGCGKDKDKFSFQQKETDRVETKSGSDNPVPPSTGTLEINDDKLFDVDYFSNENKRMIIRTGTINIEVEKFKDTEKKIFDASNRFSGYITNTTSNLNAGGKEQGSISVRIPSEKFDAFISEVNVFGRVMSQNFSGNDVTKEYIDLAARQKTQEELEKRLLQLLSERTAILTDVVEVEEKLSSVRENIERTEGRMKFLKDQSAFSSLTISLFEPSLLQTSSGGGFFMK